MNPGAGGWRYGLRWFLGRLNLALFGVVLIAASFWFTDSETNRHPAAPHVDLAAAAAQRAAHPPEGRIYILLLDSLRYETAMDPAIMPNLAALRAESAWARVMPGFNASSAAAIRTAFTGRENAAVLAFVSTFFKTDAGVESIFHQLAAAGYRTAAYSTGFFKQFGAGIAYEKRLLYRCPPELEDATVDEALAALNRGDYDIIVSHIGYTDTAAHDNGIGRPAYNAAFRRADALIPRIRARLPAGATLVVLGDHGHDELGRHGFGTDYATLGVYCGPAFRRGFSLGTITLPSHRYLLSKAAGLPLRAEGYAGQYLPEALAVHGNERAALLAEVRSAPDRAAWPAGLWTCLALLFSLWLNLAARGWSPLNFDGARMLAPWLALFPLALSGVIQPVAMGAALLLVLVITGRGVPAGRIAAWVGGPALGALAFLGWGYVLWALRPELHALAAGTLTAFWLTAIAAAAVGGLSRRWRWALPAGLLATAALLAFPTNYAYGQSSAFTPVLWCWFAAYAVSAWRGAGEGRDLSTFLRLAAAAAGLVAFTETFWASTAQNHLFAGWRSLVPGLDTENVVWLAAAGLAAKAVIYFPRYPGLPRTLLGAALIGLSCFVDWRAWIPDFYGWLWLLGVSALAWLLALRAGRPEARMLGLTFLFLAYVYNIVPNVADFTETTCLLAALVLAARLLRKFPQPEHARADALVLGVLGLYVVGWAMCRWSVTHLEWARAYRWVPPPVVERYAPWFVPWIALKSTLPWAIVAGVLRFEFAGTARFPANELLVLVALKVAATVLVNAGLGGLDTLNHSYLEAAQVSGLMALILLCMLLTPGSWPRPAGAPGAGA